MTKKYGKLVEAPAGTGEVWKDGQYRSTVNYSLEVEHEIELTETPLGTGELLSAIRVRGVIEIIRGEQTLTEGDRLTLHLADGRYMEFIATGGGILSGAWYVVNSNPAGLVLG